MNVYEILAILGIVELLFNKNGRLMKISLNKQKVHDQHVEELLELLCDFCVLGQEEEFYKTPPYFLDCSVR